MPRARWEHHIITPIVFPNLAEIILLEWGSTSVRPLVSDVCHCLFHH